MLPAGSKLAVVKNFPGLQGNVCTPAHWRIDFSITLQAAFVMDSSCDRIPPHHISSFFLDFWGRTRCPCPPVGMGQSAGCGHGWSWSRFCPQVLQGCWHCAAVHQPNLLTIDIDQVDPESEWGWNLLELVMVVKRA